MKFKKKERKRNENIKRRKKIMTTQVELNRRIVFNSVGSNPSKSNPVNEIGGKSHEAKQSTYIVK